MKLSVIVPVYNAEKFLRRCLDSLVGQTVGDYELILVNDGSTDSSQTIIDEYAAARPELITAVTVPNGGQGRARNAGLNLARGDWLGFVDSDDWVDAGMYEKLLSAAERQGADMAVCGMLGCHDGGRRESLPVWREGRPLSAAGSVCNKLFKRAAVGQLRFPEGLWYEDFAFSARLILEAEKIAFVDEDLYFYRLGHSSTMNNSNTRKNLDIITIMEGLKGPTLAKGGRDGFEELLINHVLLETVKRLAAQDTPDRREVTAEIRAYVRENIPNLLRCPSFQRESFNRRVIMFLNYHGLERLSLFILGLKGPRD